MGAKARLSMTQSGRPRVGLALGGGGMRGATHIGVLKYLMDQGMPIDVVGGTSAGSIVAMLYSLGWEPHEMETWAKSLEKAALVDYWGRPSRWMPRMPMGIVRGQNFTKVLYQASNGKRFDELQIPTAIPAVDIYSGQQIVFCSSESQGLIAPQLDSDSLTVADEAVALAVRASCSIPGVFEPVRFGPYLLVDGGVRNNVPADLVRFGGADFVIAVALGFALQDDESLDSILEVLAQTTAIMGQEISRLRLDQYADVVIRPKLEKAGLTDFHQIPELIEAGYRAAEAAWPQISRRYRRLAL